MDFVILLGATTSGHNDEEEMSWDEEDDAEPKAKSDIPKREVEEYLEKLEARLLNYCLILKGSDGDASPKETESTSAPQTPTPVRAEAPPAPEPAKVELKVEAPKEEKVEKEAPKEAPAKQGRTPREERFW